MNCKQTNLLGALALLAAALTWSADASAVTIEQAIAQCRGVVRECVRQKMGGQHVNPEPYIPGCKATVGKACVARLIGASGLKNNPLDAATEPASGATAIALAASQKRVVPPRTIADITAILDQERPDPARLKKLQTVADASPPADSGMEAANFYFGRSLVRSELGRFGEAIADAQTAVRLATGRAEQLVLNNYRQTVIQQYLAAGQPKLALEVLLKMVADGERGERGFLFSGYRLTASTYLALGDFDRARSYVEKLQQLWRGANSIRGYDEHARTWEANIHDAKAVLAEAHGQLEDALQGYQRAEALRRQGIDSSTRALIAIPRARLEAAADILLLSTARVKSKLGRIAEAESDARRALLNRLKATGKYNPQTANYIAALGSLLIEQGRYEEAKKLFVATVDIYRQLGVAEDSQTFAGALSNIASVEALEGHWADASATFAAIEQSIKAWEPSRQEGLLLTHGYIEMLFKTQKIDDGLRAARRLLEIKQQFFGEQHPDTALARGHYAVGLALSNHDDEALKEFRASAPLLAAMTFNTDNDDVLNAAARTRYTQVVVETYIDVLMRTAPGTDAASETFRLAEAVRNRAVQKALIASGARMRTSNPALAAILRHEQDLRQQIGTQLGQLNSFLALPAMERNEAGVAALRTDIDKMRAEHTKVRVEIDHRFPEYAQLIEPKPPTIDEIKQLLHPGEAMLSFYFGRDGCFVWAIPKEGSVEFAAIPESAAVIDAKIIKLREGLEPNAATITDIPAFDVALAYELYELLLKPVENGWKPAKNLILATNGAFGLLPLGLLPTAPAEIKTNAEISSDAHIALRGLAREQTVNHLVDYRNVSWLARAHAVTLVPSASALRTLRQLPTGSDKRQPVIGFGDPLFNQQQAAQAEAAIRVTTQVADVTTGDFHLRRRAAPDTRGVESAQLGLLPRLPDTADELKSIALALHADPSKVLNLGKSANEETVKRTDLSKYRIIVFATHGLVPGDLDGLHQPALALSAPEVAGVPGDGLLTMEEILALKLDADWVVLSACNTGAGAAAGAEAASGLGRAFFYAGTRAILVTNWSVHSDSARQLVSDIFARQTADPTLTRGEALRQAMMALLDGPGFTNPNGKTLFLYDHPLFWAPYTIIGDSSGS